MKFGIQKLYPQNTKRSTQRHLLHHFFNDCIFSYDSTRPAEYYKQTKFSSHFLTKSFCKPNFQLFTGVRSTTGKIMNKTQHEALLEAIKIDKKNLLKYQQIYKYAYILSDGIFKIVFAEEKDHTLLISLVNAMLDLHGDAAIKSITLEMQEYPGIFNKKNCILDIIGTTNAGEKVLVEVQQKKDMFFRDRVEYYISRVIENQVHTSEKYELPQIYFLGLLDFEMFPEEPTEYIHRVDETCHGKKFFPKIQKIFVEIEKFLELENAGTTKNDNSDAAQWLRAIKAIIKEETAPETILQNKTFQRLIDSVKLINFAEELFNREVKNMTDLKAEHEEGHAEGKAEGRSETQNDAVSVLQSMGLPAEKVAEFKAKLEALKPQTQK